MRNEFDLNDLIGGFSIEYIDVYLPDCWCLFCVHFKECLECPDLRCDLF